MWAMLRIARPSWRSHSMSLRLDRRDSQRRSSVGMAEQLEDDRGGEGRGHGFLAQHVEQRAVVRFERHAFDREIGAGVGIVVAPQGGFGRSEEHTSELQSLMRISYAVFCLKKKINNSLLSSNTTQHNSDTSTYTYLH